MIMIDTSYEIGDTVYLKTDRDQQPRIVTGFCVRSTGITVALACGSAESWHYDFEITIEKNVLV